MYESGVRYTMLVGKEGRAETREKLFIGRTRSGAEQKRDTFVRKIEQHPKFYRFESWHDSPKGGSVMAKKSPAKKRKSRKKGR